jgi:hypothetical protein
MKDKKLEKLRKEAIRNIEGLQAIPREYESPVFDKPDSKDELYRFEPIDDKIAKIIRLK